MDGPGGSQPRGRYRIHYDVQRDRWYLTASWQIPASRTVPMAVALADGVIGVDMNADHLAARRLDTHGHPTGHPRRFPFDLSGTAQHRDAQIRHALTRLLHWAKACGVTEIAVEDLDFTAGKTREKHGRKRRFRQLVSGMPTGRLRARLTSMADRTGIAVIAVDPAYRPGLHQPVGRPALAEAPRFVAAGLGVSLVPRLGLGSRHPRVVVREVRDPVPVRGIHVVVRETAPAQPALDAFIDALRAAAGGSESP